MSPRDVQRLHIRSTVAGVDHDKATRWCLDNGYAGVGWGLWDTGSDAITWEEYVARSGGANSNVKRFHDLAVGALIWTRERNGVYWLGELSGEWEYRDNATAHELDLFNVRPTAWRRIGTEDRVPGRVVNAFRSSMTLQRIGDQGAREYTARLHAQVFEGQANLDRPDTQTVIASLLGAEDLEDLVAVYLQDRFGYLVVSRLRSTPGYEYVLRRRTDGARAVVTVKSGDTPVDLHLLPSHEVDHAFAFAVSGEYVGPVADNVTCISPLELADFVETRRQVLPRRVTGWLT